MDGGTTQPDQSDTLYLQGCCAVNKEQWHKRKHGTV